LSDTHKTAKINFITSRAVDTIRTAYYIHMSRGGEINFAILYVLLNGGVIKAQFCLHLLKT